MSAPEAPGDDRSVELVASDRPGARPGGRTTKWPPRSRRRWFWPLAAALVLAFAGATAHWLVWPAKGDTGHADAVVMLNGAGDRLAVAVHLGRAHVAPFLVISRGSPTFGHGSACAPPLVGVKVICFDPHPSTTRGEAEFIAQLANRYHWRSVVLVTTADQDTRARLRVGRCFHGHISVATAPRPLRQWPYAIAYEWAALAKAVVIQTSC